jgi:hypothetical protein
MHIVDGPVIGAATIVLLGVFVLAFGVLPVANAEEPEKKVECKVICGDSDEEISPECAEFLEEFTDAEGNIDCEAILEKFTDEEGNVDCEALLGEFSDDCCPDGKKMMKIMICKPPEEEKG